MIETSQKIFPEEMFNYLKKEIIGLIKTLEREDFPAINSFLFKITNFYSDYVSDFIGLSIHDDNHETHQKINHFSISA
ncbi:MAG: hypothetical protein ACXABO_16320 [Promethearchaeota archaeon]